MAYKPKRDRPRFLMRGGPSSFPTRPASRESELLLVALRDPPVATVTTPLEKAVGYMVGGDIRRLPIVRPSSLELIGELPLMHVVDYLGGGERSKIIAIKHGGNYYRALREPVGTLMKKNPVHVDMYEKIDKAIELMARTGVGTLIIVDEEGRVRGIFTERHVLRLSIGKLMDVYVSDIMTPKVITARPDSTIAEACRIMVTNGFRRLPIVDDGQLVGIFTAMGFLRFIAEKEVYRALVTGRAEEVFSTPLSRIMKTEVVTTTPYSRAPDAAQLMVEKGVGCLPVVEDGRLVGIVTERDFLRLSIS